MDRDEDGPSETGAAGENGIYGSAHVRRKAEVRFRLGGRSDPGSDTIHPKSGIG